MAHEHPVLDTDVRFVIDPITRKIKNESGKSALTKGDHNSERFTFEVARYVADGHDMSLCNVVGVHYTNTDAKNKDAKSRGLYIVKDLHVDHEDENKVVFSWPIHRTGTRYAGPLNFSIKFKCIIDGGEEFGWGTPTFVGISIADCEDNSEAIEEEYTDAISAIAGRLDDLEKNGVGGGKPKGIKELDLLAQNWQKKTDGEWFQTFEFDFVTQNTDVEIRIDENAVKILENKTLTFDVANENGVVFIRAIGENMPTHDYTVQLVCEEVTWL